MVRIYSVIPLFCLKRIIRSPDTIIRLTSKTNMKMLPQSKFDQRTLNLFESQLSNYRIKKLKHMKTNLLFASLLLGFSTFAQEADSTGLEGDNLDLSAVMELFKESESPEDFEKKLNTESSKVNNLDLDDDGEVDYIEVVDTGDSTSHVLALQVSVTESETQDIAVIELEETSTDVVQIQIIGDEELYGENYILTPESAGNSPVIVNVIMWRPVRFMWAPGYVLWVSPWRHRHHPAWFKPWKRKHWRAYHAHVAHHHRHYRRVHAPIITHAHAVHYHRTHSATFYSHHHPNKTVNKTAGANEKSTGTESTERKRAGSISTGSESNKSTEGNTPKSNEKGTKTKTSNRGTKEKTKTTKTKSSGAGKTKTKSRSSGQSGRRRG